MLILLPVLIFWLIALALLLVRLARPKFGYFWLIAAGGSLLSWPLVLLARLWAPTEISFAEWLPESLFPFSLSLLLDSTSWSLSFALSTLALAVMLSDIASSASSDETPMNWSALRGCMAIIGSSLLSVLAGNLLTLILSWTVLDIVEFTIRLGSENSKNANGSAIRHISFRFAGTFGIILASVWSGSQVLWMNFSTGALQANVLLILALVIRMGTLPVLERSKRETPPWRGLRTTLILATGAANIVLLIRFSQTGLSAEGAILILILAGMTGIYGGLSWLGAKDETEGQAYWLLSLVSLVLASTVQSLPLSSLAWSISLIVPGALLFQYSIRRRWLLPLLVIGAYSISGLPFSATRWSVNNLISLQQPIMWLFLVIQGLVLAGYVRLSLMPGGAYTSAERWVWVIYPWGLGLLPISHFIITYWGIRGGGAALNTPAGWLAYWPAYVSCGLAFLFFIIQRRWRYRTNRLIPMIGRILALEGLFSFLRRAHRYGSSMLMTIHMVLESSGGILWALLLAVLFIALYAQFWLSG